MKSPVDSGSGGGPASTRTVSKNASERVVMKEEFIVVNLTRSSLVASAMRESPQYK